MDEAGLTVSAVARRLGVSPSTVRTWDRRYGLGPTHHLEGGRREYAPLDVERLDRMRHLVQQGVPAAQAARAALIGGQADVVPGAGAGSGGRVLSLPGRSAAARGFGAAAMAMDADACHEILTSQLAEHGVVETWDTLVTPVLVALGRRWADLGDAIEVEHLVSEVVLGCLSVVARPSVPLPGARPVLLVGVEGEGHSLALHALSAALRERHVDVRMLGTGAPAETVAAATARLGPSSVVVWAQLQASADVTVFDVLPPQRPPVRSFAAGPGWAAAPVPAGVELLTSLAGAVRRLAAPAPARRPRATSSSTTAASAP